MPPTQYHPHPWSCDLVGRYPERQLRRARRRVLRGDVCHETCRCGRRRAQTTRSNTIPFVRPPLPTHHKNQRLAPMPLMPVPRLTLVRSRPRHAERGRESLATMRARIWRPVVPLSRAAPQSERSPRPRNPVASSLFSSTSARKTGGSQSAHAPCRPEHRRCLRTPRAQRRVKCCTTEQSRRTSTYRKVITSLKPKR
jgi:hypothetical protein